jgi:hypothetical protein
VGLIEDKDFVAISGWSKDCSLAQISGIVNTVMARSVNFNYVKRTRSITRELNAAWAFSAWSISWSFGAV